MHDLITMCASQRRQFTPFERVSVLSEALPYLQRFAGKTVVIKYGGAAMKDPSLKVSPSRGFFVFKLVKLVGCRFADLIWTVPGGQFWHVRVAGRGDQ